MILGSSKDPVLIKKIYLQLWTLRDEVEAVVKSRVESGDAENISVEDLIEEYKTKVLPTGEESVTLEVLNGGKSEEDNSEETKEPEETEEPKNEEVKEDEVKEDEVKEDEAEEQSADSPEVVSSEEDKEDEKQDAPVEIIQRRPNIPKEKVYNGTTVLTELNMEEMYFFSNQSFLEGQSIVIEFLVPNKFIINANVFYSRPYNLKSRIIRDNNLIYRVAVRFSFLKPGERTLLRRFVQSVEPDITKYVKPKPVQKKQDEGFDDLDDLDL